MKSNSMPQLIGWKPESNESAMPSVKQSIVSKNAGKDWSYFYLVTAKKFTGNWPQRKPVTTRNPTLSLRQIPSVTMQTWATWFTFTFWENTQLQTLWGIDPRCNFGLLVEDGLLRSEFLRVSDCWPFFSVLRGLTLGWFGATTGSH